MDDSNLLMEFPCEFIIKVVGWADVKLEKAIEPVLEKHIGNKDIKITARHSKGKKYISLTVSFTAESKEQLDNLYSELSSRPDVLIVL